MGHFLYSASVGKIFSDKRVAIVELLVFLQRRHTHTDRQTDNFTDATDQSTHAPATAGVGNYSWQLTCK